MLFLSKKRNITIYYYSIGLFTIFFLNRSLILSTKTHTLKKDFVPQRFMFLMKCASSLSRLCCRVPTAVWTALGLPFLFAPCSYIWQCVLKIISRWLVSEVLLSLWNTRLIGVYWKWLKMRTSHLCQQVKDQKQKQKNHRDTMCVMFLVTIEIDHSHVYN